MNKQFKIIEYALSSLLRRKYKTISIIIAFTVSVSALTSVLFLTHALRTEANFMLRDVPDITVQRILGGRQTTIPLIYAEKIRSIRGVSKVTPRYWGYYYDGLTDANYTVIGSGGVKSKFHFLIGDLPLNDTECAVGSGIDALRGASRSGELILVNSQDIGTLFEVSGVFTSESAILTNDLLVLTDQAVRDFFSIPENQATDLVLHIPNSRELGNVAAKIRQFFPDARPITKSELHSTYDTMYNWRSGMMLTVFCAAIISFCILAWDKATGISAEEKREIGILKAIGWDTSDVLALKFWEGVIISLTAFLAGTLISYLHIFYFDAALLAAVIKGWSTLFPAFSLAPDINVFHLLVVGFFTVVPYVASTLFPSWKTAVTDPDMIMRG